MGWVGSGIGGGGGAWSKAIQRKAVGRGGGGDGGEGDGGNRGGGLVLAWPIYKPVCHLHTIYNLQSPYQRKKESVLLLQNKAELCFLCLESVPSFLYFEI